MTRVRFAPSPTGFVHIGSLRTALYNYLYAKKTGGTYVLRVEDTDQSRLVEGAVEGMLKAMKWAGVVNEEGVVLSEEGKVTQAGDCGPYVQSERLDIYKKYIDQLLESGHAYYCFCSKDRLDKVREIQRAENKVPRYDGHCKGLTKEEVQAKIDAGEPYVIRLKLPANKDIHFKDIVRGDVVINTNDMDDQVLMKSDGFPTYHFAVVVDDYLMGITHIIRGEEWLPSTPKHVYLYEAFGWEQPTYVHLPNILNHDHKKLSKRQGDVAVEDFRKKGYLPEALINYIALLGWSHEDNQEVFSMDELEQYFSLERVSKSGGVFDVAKLNWFNNQYIRERDINELVDLSIPFLVEQDLMTEEEANSKKEWLALAMETVRESMDYLSQFPERIKLFISEEVEVWEGEALEFMNLPHMPKLLEVLEQKIGEQEEITPDFVSDMFKEIKKEEGIKGKELFMGTRVILTGQNHGPEIPKVLTLLGKDKLMVRLNQAKEYVLNEE